MTQQENIISAQIDGGLHEKQALLDDFAKTAMHGMISNNWSNLSVSDEAIAREAYDIAEAMMQERERRMKG